jgi:hypothetical protein
MVLIEFRIPLPLSVDEFHRGQLAMVAQKALMLLEAGEAAAAAGGKAGAGEAVEWIRNEPYDNRDGHWGVSPITGVAVPRNAGQYTLKRFHVKSKLPAVGEEEEEEERHGSGGRAGASESARARGTCEWTNACAGVAARRGGTGGGPPPLPLPPPLPAAQPWRWCRRRRRLSSRRAGTRASRRRTFAPLFFGRRPSSTARLLAPRSRRAGTRTAARSSSRATSRWKRRVRSAPLPRGQAAAALAAAAVAPTAILSLPRPPAQFRIDVETLHVPDDAGGLSNALSLTPAELAERKVEVLDIVDAYSGPKSEHPEWNALTYKSASTGRGPLPGQGWFKAPPPAGVPRMCCYKLVRCKFNYFPIKVRSAVPFWRPRRAAPPPLAPARPPAALSFRRRAPSRARSPTRSAACSARRCARRTARWTSGCPRRCPKSA